LTPVSSVWDWQQVLAPSHTHGANKAICFPAIQLTSIYCRWLFPCACVANQANGDQDIYRNASSISCESILQKEASLKLKDLGRNVLSKSVKNIVLELISEALLFTGSHDFLQFGGN
jgi:hypothetical protein